MEGKALNLLVEILIQTTVWWVDMGVKKEADILII